MFDPLTAASNVSGVAGPSGQGVADLEGGEDEGRGLFGELQEGAVSGRPSMIASLVGSR